MRETLAPYGIAAIFILAAYMLGVTLRERHLFKTASMRVTYFIFLWGWILIMLYSITTLIIWGFKH